MLKKFFVLIMVAFTAVVSAQMTERDTVFNRFRSINIQNNQMVTLQSSVDNIKDVIIKSSNDHYCLKRDAFIRVDSIDLEVNIDNKILAIAFYYDTTYSCEKAIYNKPLGAGKEFLFSSEDFTFKCTQWEDKLTIFELVELTSKGKVQVYSVIFDKAMFLGKYKNCLGAFNVNYSFDLFRTFLRN